MNWTAFVDESIRIKLGIYVLAAVLIESPDVERVRAAALSLPRPKGLRFHWREHGPSGQRAAAHLVAGLSSLHVVVVGVDVDPPRQERARRKCLGELLYRLEAAGVTQVWIESRGQAADSRDIAAVRAFRAQHVIEHAIRVDHAQPGDESVLWIADAVAGAVSTAEAGEPTYRDLLSPSLTEHRITLT